MKASSVWEKPWMWAACGAAAMLLVVVGVLGGVATDFALGAAQHKAASASATFTVHGTLTLTDSNDQIGDQYGECQTGDTGYSDISAGTPVTVTGDSGQSLAVGALAGYNAPTANECVFTFTVTGVPTGQRLYGVEVGKRGAIEFSASQIRDGADLSLGQ